MARIEGNKLLQVKYRQFDQNTLAEVKRILEFHFGLNISLLIFHFWKLPNLGLLKTFLPQQAVLEGLKSGPKIGFYSFAIDYL